MDGNHRWAEKNQINSYDSYIKGSEKLLEISDYIFNNYETQYITAFALSKNNLKRTNDKIRTLKSVIKYFLNDLDSLSKFKFRISIKGNLSFLNNQLIRKVNDLNSRNLKYKKSLIILINYSGQDDIINSLTKISKFKLKINKANFEKNLFLGSISNPDLLIRTGGYQRISNFMLYQLSFTDFFFLKKLWPDLKKNDVRNIINNFRKINRKFGL
jgi:undecaprenyl diphosphate synthase